MKKYIIFLLLIGSTVVLGQNSVNKSSDTNSSSKDKTETYPTKNTNGENEKINKKIETLNKEIEKLKKFKAEQELKALRQEAMAQTNEKKDDFDTNKTFSGGQTAQQALNPEISVVTDMGFKANIADPPSNENNRTGAYFRVAAFHIQSDLDPFSKTFIGIEVHPEGIELGEAFIDWNGLIPSLTIRVGKFLQNFGIINRWHMPSLDQFDNPLPAVTLLGGKGKLNNYGISLHWIMPALWASSNELFLEITNSSNPNLFGGEAYSVIPTTLLRLVNYYDLSQSDYLNIGFSGIMGPNNKYHAGFDENGKEINEDTRFTYLGGMDLTFLHENPKFAKTSSFLWRTELYYLYKDLGKDKLKAYGAYSYMQAKVTERISLGTRFDYTQPAELDNSDKYTYQVVPYLTFMQSPWVKIRLQYNFKNGTEMDKADHRIILQFIWAAGPHKHERY